MDNKRIKLFEFDSLSICLINKSSLNIFLKFVKILNQTMYFPAHLSALVSFISLFSDSRLPQQLCFQPSMVCHVMAEAHLFISSGISKDRIGGSTLSCGFKHERTEML